MANTTLRWNATVADLRNDTGMVSGEVCVLEGYHAAGDGGGGLLFWDASSNAFDDGGAIFQRHQVAITGATNATPIVITANAHGFANGNTVAIRGVLGNTAANNKSTTPTWTVSNQTTNTFELSGSSGNGAYASGGYVAGTGRWRRQYVAPADIRFWGAQRDVEASATSNRAAIHAALAYLTSQSGGTLYVPSGTFYVDDTIELRNADSIHFRFEKSMSASAGPANLSGAFLKVASSFPAGATVLRLSGCKSCSVEDVGIDGADNTPVDPQTSTGPVYLAGTGLEITTDQTGQYTLMNSVVRGNILRCKNFERMRCLDAGQPAVTLETSGKTYLIGLRVKIIDGGGVGTATFQWSQDNGRNLTWSATITTAATYAITATTTLKFQAGGIYAAGKMYIGACGTAIHVGMINHLAQCDTATVDNVSVNACNIGYLQEGNQTAMCRLYNSNFATDERGVVVCDGTLLVQGNAINGPQTAGIACIEIRPHALEVQLIGNYLECQGGHVYWFPTSGSRSQQTTMIGERVLWHQTGNSGKIVEYEQIGPVVMSGCTIMIDSSGEQGEMRWVSGLGGAKPLIDIHGMNYINPSGLTKVISGVTYRETNQGFISGAFGNGFEQTNSCIEFDRMISSNLTAAATGLPRTGVYREDVTDRFMRTDVNRNHGDAIDPTTTPLTTAWLVRANVGAPSSGGSYAELRRLERLRLGPVGSAYGGRQAAIFDGFVPTDIGSALVWLRADRGITLAATLRASGTSPPTINITTGDLNASTDVLKGLRVEITTAGALGTSRFRWSDDDGTTWIQSDVATATAVVLPRLAFALAFASGPYATDNVYRVTVAAWTDQSTQGWNVSQSTAGLQPIYKARNAAFNNLPSLEWEASNTASLTTGLVTTVAQPITWWIVGVATDSSNRTLIDNASGASRNHISAQSSPSVHVNAYAGTSTSWAQSLTSPFAISVEFNGTSSRAFINGTLGPTLSPGTAGSSGLTVGVDQSGGGNYFRGSICEVFAVTKIPDGHERRAVDAYLRAKWGTP